MENPILPQATELLSSINMSELVWGLVLFFTAIFALYSLTLLYHWLRYGRGVLSVFIIIPLYFGVSLILLGSIYSSALVLAT
jgi:hypothetical protein